MTEPREPPEIPEAEQPTVAAFGRWLRQQREVRQLSRDEVVRTTRLAAAVIDGLESGDPARMPPSGYVYGYLRTYAGALGLDADDVVLRWQEVEVASAPPAPAERRALPLRSIAIGAAVAVAALAAAAALLLR